MRNQQIDLILTHFKTGGTVQPNNWPPLPSWFPIKPCFYHDISLEIPLDFQKSVRHLYYLWMTYVLCLFLNVLGNMTFWVKYVKLSKTHHFSRSRKVKAKQQRAKQVPKISAYQFSGSDCTPRAQCAGTFRLTGPSRAILHSISSFSSSYFSSRYFILAFLGKTWLIRSAGFF